MSQDHQAALRRYFEGHPDLGVASAYPVMDRLAKLRRHLDHLRELRPRVTDPEDLRQSLSLSNDVLHSLHTVCQVVIYIAGELSTRRGLRFQDYTEAVRNLNAIPGFSSSMVRDLEELPGIWNLLVHEYLMLDYTVVIEALDRLGAVEEFAEAVRRVEVGA